MSKLFNKEEVGEVTYSAEEFVEYYRTASVVSTEAIGDFFSIVKDKITTMSNTVFTDMDSFAIDATAKRFETLSAIKRVNFSDIANDNVQIPERFQGKLTELGKDLITASEYSVPAVLKLLDEMKMAIAGFLNEYEDDGVIMVYGKKNSSVTEGLLDKNKQKVSKYFRTNKANSYAKAKDVLNRTGDVEVMLNDVKVLESHINTTKLNAIAKLSGEVTELVDVLIEQNRKSNILGRNDSAKRDLVEMIHVSAEAVETVAYLYTNVVQFYTCLRALTEQVIVASNR